MRLKKQKRHRKAVRFYTVCHGFRQPFKVLCDGTFVHHLVVNSILPADTALSKNLGGPVKLFTTRCVVEELKRRGKSYTETLEAAHKLMIARCDHEKRKTADACILEIIGEKNLEHFFVASQDADLRKKLQEVPAVPLVFGLRNALFLEPPSKDQLQFAKSSEEERLHMNDFEKKLLKLRTNELLENEKVGDSPQENLPPKVDNLEPKLKKHSARKSLDVKNGPQFKRKKAKNPNPLSIKKKKNRENPHAMPAEGQTARDDSVRSRNRKRKRSNKGKKIAETSS